MGRQRHVPDERQLRLLVELELIRVQAERSEARRRQLVKEARAAGATLEEISAASGYGSTTVDRILSS
jgi:hypothetical protein